MTHPNRGPRWRFASPKAVCRPRNAGRVLRPTPSPFLLRLAPSWAGHQRWPLFAWKESPSAGVLTIDTRAVLSRLTTSPTAFHRLKPSSGGGFLRDAPVPRRELEQIGTSVAELPPLRRAATPWGRSPGRSDRFRARPWPSVVRQGWQARSLCTVGHPAHIGGRVDCDVADGVRGRARLHRTSLERVQPTQDRRRDEVVDDDSDRRARGPAHKPLRAYGCRGRRSRSVKKTIRSDTSPSRSASRQEQIALSDSQITRFFDFLEDEALVRIRLHVTYRLMDAIAEAAAGRPVRRTPGTCER